SKIRIGYFRQVQSFRWHRNTRYRAVLALDDGMHVFGRMLASADFQQGSDNGSDHVTEKPIGGDIKHELILLIAIRPTPLGARDVTVMGMHLRMGLAEAGKVFVLQ